jgi:hypothetical protein
VGQIIWVSLVLYFALAPQFSKYKGRRKRKWCREADLWFKAGQDFIKVLSKKWVSWVLLALTCNPSFFGG